MATTIMGLAVVGLVCAISNSMRNAARLTDYDRATLLARRKMDELLLDSRLPKLTPFEGKFDPTATAGVETGWRAQVSPFELGPNPMPGAVGLERIELEIWWMSGEKRRSLQLDGYRRAVLGPEEAGVAP